eukprot:2199049-Lingulodinium_polyedra.AAC.1
MGPNVADPLPDVVVARCVTAERSHGEDDGLCLNVDGTPPGGQNCRDSGGAQGERGAADQVREG